MKKNKRHIKEEIIRKTMREIIEYDREIGAFKFSKATVHIKHGNGAYTTKNLNEDEIIDYIVMTTGKVAEKIPTFYKSILDPEDSEEGYNKLFHNRICEMRKTYRLKAEKELNNEDSAKAAKYSLWSMIGTLMSLIVAIISLGLTINALPK